MNMRLIPPFEQPNFCSSSGSPLYITYFNSLGGAVVFGPLDFCGSNYRRRLLVGGTPTYARCLFALKLLPAGVKTWNTRTK